jgi:hypothetical protein
MTNCEWANSKIEAYFTDELSGEDQKRFQTHLAVCAECMEEVESLRHMDTLVRGVFRRRIAIAQLAAQTNPRPRILRIVFAGAGLAVAAALLVTGIPLFQQPPAPPITTKIPEPPKLQEDVKKDNTAQNSTYQAKPGVTTPPKPTVEPTLDSIPPDAPDFAISDAAGIPETYRGRMFLFGVVSRDQRAAITGLQQIHNALASTSAVRIVGVTRRHEEDFEGATFPVFVNHGSKLFGIKDGEFLLVDATGTPRLKGTLSDRGNVARVRSQLEQLNVR